MIKPPLVFVDVDTQRDFLLPGGALKIEGSEGILPNLAKLTAFALAHKIPIIATACDHQEDDEEFQVFPPHCVAGTLGQTRVDATRVDGLILPVDQLFTGETPLHLTLTKSQYDVFHREDAGRVFEAYDANRTTKFVVYGVATDYCVRCVVEGLLTRGHHVSVVVDAIRAVDSEAETETIANFLRLGAVLTMTDRVCS